MTVFISYSHADKKIVDELAAKMVNKNASVWVDTWELNVGDSILQRVQDAITESDALLVILSKASVASEWCKRELSSGLMRELDEKRVIVLPVLLEDCEIPLFLREKMYADIRTDIDSGVHEIMNAIAKVANPNQSRIEDDDGFLDWAVDWDYSDGNFGLKFTVVNSINSLRISFLTEIYVRCNDVISQRQRQFHEAGIGWLGRMIISEALFDFGESKEFKVLLEDTRAKKVSGGMRDEKVGAEYDITVTCRKMGEDNGKDQLVNISDILKSIRDYMKSAHRKPNDHEQAEYLRIISKPMGS